MPNFGNGQGYSYSYHGDPRATFSQFFGGSIHLLPSSLPVPEEWAGDSEAQRAWILTLRSSSEALETGAGRSSGDQTALIMGAGQVPANRPEFKIKPLRRRFQSVQKK